MDFLTMSGGGARGADGAGLRDGQDGFIVQAVVLPERDRQQRRLMVSRELWRLAMRDAYR
jgi:hypothetical protein